MHKQTRIAWHKASIRFWDFVYNAGLVNRVLLPPLRDSLYPKHAASGWRTNTRQELNCSGARIGRSDNTLFIDVSQIASRDEATGIQRVVRCITEKIWLNHSSSHNVKLVYGSNCEGCYRSASALLFPNSDLNKPEDLRFGRVEPARGDILLCLDYDPHGVLARQPLLRKLKAKGVRVLHVVYDLLPIDMPQFFTPRQVSVFKAWLNAINQSNGALCISNTIYQQLRAWRHQNKRKCEPFYLTDFSLGCDRLTLADEVNLVKDQAATVARIQEAPAFLMVGTMEPRKGHAQVLAAFEESWAKNQEMNLVIVGKQGWMVKELSIRIKDHPLLNKRLFWLEGISDQYLEKIYAACTCLLAASYGEGFGLPLVEAARHGIPILARDIPVFREVAGNNAAYFQAQDAAGLALSLNRWLADFRRNKHPKSQGINYCTWAESASMVLSKCMNQKRIAKA